ncbi:MAG: ATP-binding protein [Proteobacteria bacterium]|nr:ATP-binding protein [Pseudomonadota bacterium]
MFTSELNQRIIQFNPWLVQSGGTKALPAKYLPAPYIHRTAEAVSLETTRALLVVGPRQSGKSTLLWHLLQDIFPHVLFLNMEDPLFRIGFKSSFDLMSLIEKGYPFIRAIFIDEIQHMEEAGLFIKGLVDAKTGFSVFAIGSSSFDLRSKTRESLAGRAQRTTLYPFSLQELLNNEPPGSAAAVLASIDRIVTDQLLYGSYPAVHLAPKRERKIELLNDLVEAFILRDASDLYRIKRVDAFRKLLSLLAIQTGSMVNLSEIASLCNTSVGTVSSHIEILEESHVIKVLRPFAGGKRREITGAIKIFFIDNGIRNKLLNSFSEDFSLRADAGQLFENWAFTELQKNMPFLGSIRFWRSKAGAEVDFVIEYGGKSFGIEVKFTGLTQPRLSKSSRSFIDAYAPERFALLNRSLEEIISVGATNVSFITPATFCSWLQGIFAS